MSGIAVAGGSGHLGRTIFEVLQESIKEPVFSLGRKAPEDGSKSALVVDYSDIAGTAKTLADNNIGTVISAISVMDKITSDAQVNLVKASVQSGTVKRFVASDWGLEHTPESFLYQFRQPTIVELKKTNLQWTTVANGYFLDYFGQPHIKTYLPTMAFAIDVPHKEAVIPGTGNDIFAVTYTFDVAKFVVKLLELPTWDPVTYLYGDRVTLNEMLALAEKARGTKFNVTYDSLESLEKGEVTQLPLHAELAHYFPPAALKAFLSLFGRWVIAGRFDIPVEQSLNAKFPEVQTKTAADIIGAWAGK